MLSWFKSLFGKSAPNFKKMVQEGAQIVDVRTGAEFSNGHIPNAQNLPLQDLKQQWHHLDKNKPVITCCASGVRSASAAALLKNNGFIAYNGGSWKSLQRQISN
ncbi:rhodanese-like domain-containing protein [Riemerella columbina]|uniref:rhodanese-like domain-containing protein n=1 Tax=Riemerella columbina TaxID=103810 RepID=UPI002670A52D|nr:rhodanese-like domain-containing protein [Riemerella columbina]WKS95196.1 rhodanese-like domain-containing protein [Riemerella columbina]